MPIRRLLAASKLATDEIDILTRAFDEALRSLSLVDRNDPLTEMIAQKVIEIGATTIRDPAAIAKMVVKKLGIPWGRLSLGPPSFRECRLWPTQTFRH